ncbi:MAG: tRNA uridine-5-carboxymethylaminomethyl(34) synthesis GTPase MnmE [Pseudomonadota bacterium]
MNGARTRATIFAPSTAAGRAGIAIVRISGVGAARALRALTRRDLPVPRQATRAHLADAASGEALDDGLVVWFPSPRSFTGEDVAELHLHGGPAVIARVLGALGRMAGLRLAEPGEFTRRAFDNGKLDLAEVEGLADLIAAETEAQARQALRQLAGELGGLTEGWRQRLLRALAHAEAEIDFPDEDLPGGLIAGSRPEIDRLAAEIAALLDDRRRGEILRDGVSVAIIGPPNAGKSSLLNALARRQAAIVSALAGTTRDVIELRLDLGGLPVIVADTAGLRELAPQAGCDQGEIEAEGIRRALARAEAADLRLMVLDATLLAHGLDPGLARLMDERTLTILNKIDLMSGGTWPAILAGRPAFAVSVKTGAGLPALLAALEREIAARLGLSDTSAPVVTRARHRQALAECQAALVRAAHARAPELVAEDLRLAARALGRITGQVGVEDVLDLIFAEFCVGK